MKTIRDTAHVSHFSSEWDGMSLEDMLESFDYRTSMNVYFARCITRSEYPKENPFSNVVFKKQMPINIGVKRLPAFLRDEENPFYHYSDILLYYTGRRIERYWRGEKVKGYLLETCRFRGNNWEETGANEE